MALYFNLLLLTSALAIVTVNAQPDSYRLRTRAHHVDHFSPTTPVDLSFCQRDLDRVNERYTAWETSPAFANDLRVRSQNLVNTANLIKSQGAKRKRQAANTSSLTLIDDTNNGQDTLFYGGILIGTPSQTFQVTPDTGSADLWVYGPNAPTTHSRFNIGTSSTIATDGTADWRISYGSGSLRGFLARDTVSLAGLRVPQQIFALANTTVPIFETLPIDGVLGMGFMNIASSRSPTFFSNLMSSNAVAQPFFSYAVQNLGNGELCLGCLDSTKYTGTINYNPVANPGYWSIALSAINVNGQAVSGTSSAAAIDTGTTLIYLPMNSYNALYTALGGSQTASGGWTVPCSNTRSVGFVFGGVSYLIPLAELNLGYASASTTTQCLYGIFGSTTVDITGAPMAVVGSLFLKQTYAVFTYSAPGTSSPAVGFAPAAIAPSAAPPSFVTVVATQAATSAQIVSVAPTSRTTTNNNTSATIRTSAPSFTPVIVTVVQTATGAASTVMVSGSSVASVSTSSTPTTAAVRSGAAAGATIPASFGLIFTMGLVMAFF